MLRQTFLLWIKLLSPVPGTAQAFEDQGWQFLGRCVIIAPDQTLLYHYDGFF
jgi:hypothetical protein